jgi:hypothetical protein
VAECYGRFCEEATSIIGSETDDTLYCSLFRIQMHSRICTPSSRQSHMTSALALGYYDKTAKVIQKESSGLQWFEHVKISRFFFQCVEYS